MPLNPAQEASGWLRRLKSQVFPAALYCSLPAVVAILIGSLVHASSGNEQLWGRASLSDIADVLAAMSAFVIAWVSTMIGFLFRLEKSTKNINRGARSDREDAKRMALSYVSGFFAAIAQVVLIILSRFALLFAERDASVMATENGGTAVTLVSAGVSLLVFGLLVAGLIGLNVLMLGHTKFAKQSWA